MKQTAVGNASRDLHVHLRVANLPPAPYERMVPAPSSPHDRHLQFLLVSRGRAMCRRDDWGCEVDERGIAMFPAGRHVETTIPASVSTTMLAVSPLLLAHAVGAYPEAETIKRMARQPLIVPDLGPGGFSQVCGLTYWMAQEYALEGGGSWMVHAGILRLLMVTLFRSGPGEGALSGAIDASVTLLGSFRQLIELHFRDQWPVSRYARELGITYGRLHHLCRREANCTPVDLVHGRLVQEAKLRLERSSDPVQEIAFRLGYSDASYFRHFFKRMTGLGPGAYRRDAQAKSAP
jgi:AraC family transcriptional regulator, transcriptional activator of pobA